MSELLSVDAALRAVLGRASPLEAETVALATAAGRVLAVPAEARVDLPPFASSAVDGYALRADDTPGRLPVVARIAAGRPAARALAAGEAMAIATGGAVPEGADAVVPIERASVTDGVVDVPDRAQAGANVRPRGGDVAAGQRVVAAGVRLGAAQVGALAAAGVAEVACVRRPRVAVLTTGTELRRPGEPLAPGEIYESNGPMLAALLAGAGAEVTLLGPVEDDAEAHRRALASGLERDLLVTSGGVSVGPHDLVRRIEAELGVEEVFWGVAVKPGKPLAFGLRGRTLVFGLPGNPVSSLVTAVLFVLPAVRALQGEARPGPLYESGALARPLQPDRRRLEFVRARLAASDGGAALDPLPARDSHMIVRAAEADALVEISPGDVELEAGARVRYVRL
ncbi:MAG TPA: gephyrin-like molybdotransferase Glp [Gaiellaceae bacterium]|nr:gephyrin-like molybdotransferase Glp [Gaiellaceae bacterium]